MTPNLTPAEKAERIADEKRLRYLLVDACPKDWQYGNEIVLLAAKLLPGLLSQLSEAEKRAEAARVLLNQSFAARRNDTFAHMDQQKVLEVTAYDLGKQCETLEEQITTLQAQLLVVTGERKRLQEALEIYADANNWNCPRCGKRDQLNCFMGRWTGPVNPPADPDFHMGEGHGYDIARKALDTVAGEPPADTVGDK